MGGMAATAVCAALALAFMAPAPAWSQEAPAVQVTSSGSKTERGLQAYADGDSESAEELLSDALRERPTDAKAAEGLLVLSERRGDRDSSLLAATALARHGNARQACVGAWALDRLGEDASVILAARPDAGTSQIVAEWIASKRLASGAWEQAAAASLSRSSFPGSWRLRLVAATSLAMLDRPAEARVALGEAEGLQPEREAFSRAKRALDAAEARASQRKEETKAAPKAEPVPVAEQAKPLPVAERRVVADTAKASPVAAPTVVARPIASPEIPKAEPKADAGERQKAPVADTARTRPATERTPAKSEYLW